MTGPSPDLDALREKAEKATKHRWTISKAEWIAAASPDVILAVLALVEEQREENERLRTVAKRIRYEASSLYSGRPEHVYLDRLVAIRGLADEALAGSPAENKGAVDAVHPRRAHTQDRLPHVG